MRRPITQIALASFALLALGCGGEDLRDGGVDAAPLRLDAGLVDAGGGGDGGVDAGSTGTDAGPRDAGAADGGAADAGATDAGRGDGGPFTCPVGLGCVVDSSTGTDYCLCNATRNWVAARAACQGAGLDLVRIDSSSEESFLTMRFSFRRYWIGATDMAMEGDFRWVDGTLFWTGGPTGAAVGGAFTNWLSGQPSDLGGTDVGDCVLVETTGGWRDDICDSVRAYRFACER